MSDLFELWFSANEKPKWRTEFEYNMSDIKRKTGLTKEQLNKVADVLEELRIIRL